MFAQYLDPIRPERLAALADALDMMSPSTVLSHRSAGELWGLWLPSFDGIEVTTPALVQPSRHTTSVQRRAVIAHRRLVQDDDITTRFGLPVTSLTRTWLDLAAELDLLDLIAAGDAALVAGASKEVLLERSVRQHRVRGVVAARRAAPLLNARSRSRPESRIRGGIVLAGLPEPDVNSPVHDRHGQWVAEPDLKYDPARLAIEFNGGDHADPARMRADSVRALDLDRIDWKVRVYTAPHAYGRMSDVIQDVYRDLAVRAPELLVSSRYRPGRSGDGFLRSVTSRRVG